MIPEIRHSSGESRSTYPVLPFYQLEVNPDDSRSRQREDRALRRRQRC
jgi:hypothetical protein